MTTHRERCKIGRYLLVNIGNVMVSSKNWIDSVVCVSKLWKIRSMKDWWNKQLGGSHTTFEQYILVTIYL